jgi:hypothetical protein
MDIGSTGSRGPERGAMEAISLQCWTEGFFRQPKAKALTAEAVNEVDAEEVDAQRPPRDKEEEEEVSERGEGKRGEEDEEEEAGLRRRSARSSRLFQPCRIRVDLRKRFINEIKSVLKINFEGSHANVVMKPEERNSARDTLCRLEEELITDYHTPESEEICTVR